MVHCSGQCSARCTCRRKQNSIKGPPKFKSDLKYAKLFWLLKSPYPPPPPAGGLVCHDAMTWLCVACAVAVTRPLLWRSSGDGGGARTLTHTPTVHPHTGRVPQSGAGVPRPHSSVRCVAYHVGAGVGLAGAQEGASRSTHGVSNFVSVGGQPLGPILRDEAGGGGRGSKRQRVKAKAKAKAGQGRD